MNWRGEEVRNPLQKVYYGRKFCKEGKATWRKKHAVLIRYFKFSLTYDKGEFGLLKNN